MASEAPSELLLLLGDAHIPMKAPEIPEAFLEILVPGFFSQTLCTGNMGISPEIQEYLKTLSKNLHLVKGEYEDSISQLPESKVTNAGKLRFGVVHGHQIVPWGDSESLSNYMRENEVDVIISGHTHEQKVERFEGKLIINPGSLTGAYGPLNLDIEPGFVVLEVKEKTVEGYCYKLVKKEVVIGKFSWTKGEKPGK